MDAKKRVLEALMSKMDNESMSGFKTEPPKSTLRGLAEEIYNILNGHDSPVMESSEPRDPPASPEEAEKRKMQDKIDAERKASEKKIRDMKMDKLADALGAFINAHKKG